MVIALLADAGTLSPIHRLQPSEAVAHETVYRSHPSGARRAGRRTVAAQLMNCSWVSAPTCTRAMCVNPADSNSRIPGTCSSTSGPHGIWPDTSSSRTVLDAASNDAGTGSSALTLQLV